MTRNDQAKSGGMAVGKVAWPSMTPNMKKKKMPILFIKKWVRMDGQERTMFTLSEEGAGRMILKRGLDAGFTLR